MSLILDGTNGVTYNDSSLQGAAASPYVLKNRIINGAMVIDQRNAGASVSITTTGSAVYTVDRWFFYVTQASKITTQQNQGSVTPPAGFSNYLGITSSSAYTPTGGDNFYVSQNIEANNISDLAWGTANAKTVTISFWVRSSLTGNFGLVVENAPTYNYSYPILYTINAANTWEYKTITIPAPTAGTWATSGNGIGVTLVFSLGIGTTYAGPSGAWAAANYNGVTGQTNVVATNGATFYITGVQLEQNTSATPFERRLYGQELANCQRYYEKSYPISVVPGVNNGNGSAFSTQNVGVTTASFILGWVNYKVTKRTDATVAIWDTVGNSGKCTRFTLGSATNTNQSITIDTQGESAMIVYSSTGSNSAGIAFQWTASAEL